MCLRTFPGGVDVRKPAAMSACAWVLTDHGTPMAVLIDTLLARGWRACALSKCPRSHPVAPEAHDLVFPLQRIQQQWRPYMQRLLSLEDLCAKGLTELPVGQKPPFYRAVLAPAAPGTVPVGLAARAYTEMCAGKDSGQTSARAAPARDIADEMSDEPLDGAVPAKPVPVAVAAAVTCGSSSGPSDEDVPLGSSGQAAALPTGEAFTSLWRHEELVRPRSSSPSGSSSSSAASTSSSMSSSTSSATIGSATMPPRARRRQPRGMSVEGVAVGVYEHAATRGAYRRLVVKCSCHSGCVKRRNSGAAQTKYLGEMEPLWFLGAWVLRGQSSADCATRMAYVPSVADVRRYSQTGAWRGGAAA